MATRRAEPLVVRYALQQLFVDQDRHLVHDTIAPVLAWVPGIGAAKKKQPFQFEVEHRITHTQVATVQLFLTWDLVALENLVPGVQDHAHRLRTGRSAQREHVAELAAYGLTFVAISALMPGRRAKAFRKGSAPDILFDLAPGALRGVETAGRSKGGRPALLVVRNGSTVDRGTPHSRGKAAELLDRADIAEVHLSLWCASPRISIMEQVKP